MTGETRKPDFLKLNPNGRVPLLEMEDGRTLAESGAILFLLTEGTHLQPTDKWARAQMLPRSRSFWRNGARNYPL
jgi:glutathione S-transferase